MAHFQWRGAFFFPSKRSFAILKGQFQEVL